MATYLQINYNDGNIFKFSKTEQEGYEPHTNTKGVVSYRKIYKKGLYGRLKGVTLRDSDFGKEVSVAVEDKSGEMNYLNMPLFDAKKNLASYAESFITVLPELKVGTPYRFYAYNIKDEGKKYATVGISVAYANLEEETVDKDNKIKKLSYTFTKEGIETKGDIPPIKWEEDFDGSKSMNAKAKNKYLYDTLIENLTASSATQTVVSAQKVATKIPTASVNEAFASAGKLATQTEIDSLPF